MIVRLPSQHVCLWGALGVNCHQQHLTTYSSHALTFRSGLNWELVLDSWPWNESTGVNFLCPAQKRRSNERQEKQFSSSFLHYLWIQAQAHQEFDERDEIKRWSRHRASSTDCLRARVCVCVSVSYIIAIHVPTCRGLSSPQCQIMDL